MLYLLESLVNLLSNRITLTVKIYEWSDHEVVTGWRLVELQRRDVVRRRHRFSGVFVGALNDFRPQGCRRLPRQDVQNRLAVFFVAKSEC